MALPERRKNGTPCQRQLSTSARTTAMVSVSESAATPGSQRYPAYWPRTTCRTSRGFSAPDTLTVSSRRCPADSDTGGSMATKPITWNRCVTIMSR